jgi:hypothetical protein
MTTYDKIYSRFLSKINDYELRETANTDPQLFDEILLKFLQGAIPKFHYCIKDLTQRDDEAKLFTVELSELEQEILATKMVLEWLTPMILREENIRQSLGSKDYKIFSSANHLQRLLDLKATYEKEDNDLSKMYYFIT